MTGRDERRTFLRQTQIEAILDRIDAGQSPWLPGFQRLVEDANATLEVSPRSVVDDGAPTDASQVHQFGTNCLEGECSSRQDYKAALRMSRWMRTLALAYQFTGRDLFARAAIDLLHHWFVAPRTRMAPSGGNHGRTPFAVQVHITIPAMIYAASLVDDHHYWEEQDPDGLQTFRTWVRRYLVDLEDGADSDEYRGTIENNIYAWWLVARGTAASYLGDDRAFGRVVDDWKTTALEQVQSDGGLEYEKQRENGLFYSIYAMKALFMTAELARNHGHDLYGYSTSGEPVLRAVSDYHAPYVLDPSRWEWGLGEEGRLTPGEFEEAAAVYELAFSEWRDRSHRRVIEAVGRPVYDRRLLGWVTLTHGNRFALDL